MIIEEFLGNTFNEALALAASYGFTGIPCKSYKTKGKWVHVYLVREMKWAS